MVNTFLCHIDFHKSAVLLDNTRLGKQRVEALQILNALYQLRFMAKYLGIPDYPIGIDTPKEQRTAWIIQVLSAFKMAGYKALHVKSNMIVQYFHGQLLPRKPDSGNQLLHDPMTNIVYEVKGKKQKIIASGPADSFILPGEELITTGYRRHPIVAAFLGFEDCLKQYINAHIDVWISRGKNNTMKKYDVPDNVPRPSWTIDEKVINNFKAALMAKEIDRKEPAWYLKFPDFVEAWATTADNARQVNQFASQLQTDQWYNCINKDFLLSFGNFSGYVWP